MNSMYRMKTDTQAPPLLDLDEIRTPTRPASGGRRIQVRRSGIHGKGVFALKPLRKGEVVIEYTGELITWREALRRHPHNPKDPHHTFYFHIDDQRVIDAKYGGNAARWINHACRPNCEADEQEGRIFIKALRKIAAGDELFYDYGLTVDERYTPALKKQYSCRCGTRGCRGTMLTPKR
jgi:SET domain-containing protein